MPHWSTRLIAALQEKSWDYPDLARASGVPLENIKKYAQGAVDNPRGDVPAKLATALGKTVPWLMHGAGGNMAPKDPTEIKSLPKFAPLPYPAIGDQDLPIKGGTMGGSGGVFVDNGQDFGMARRPSILEGVKNAYAVYVFGDSMEPKYSAGQLIFVNPNKPVSQGAFVVIQLHPEADGGEHEYLVKRFIRQDAKRLQVEEFNYTAPRKFDIPSQRVIAVHRIVASEEA